MKTLSTKSDVEGDLFVSDHVSENILEEKIFLTSYDYEKILIHIPYSEHIYVAICPCCIKRGDFKNLSRLVDRRAIVPVLLAPYKKYPDYLIEYIYPRDHLSCYEHDVFRFLSIMSEHKSGLCHHCVGKWKDSVRRAISRREDLSNSKRDMDRVLTNIFPYVKPDSELLDNFKEAVINGDRAKIQAISNMSWTVHAMRSAQAFNSPMLLAGKDLAVLPMGVAKSIDESKVISESLSRSVASGLGLLIPNTISIDEYIDIAQDFRPKIRKLINGFLGDGGVESKEQIPLVQKELMSLNREIQRLKTTRRYMLLEACLDFYGKNLGLMNAALTASAFGVAGAMAGCVGGPAVAGGVGAAASGVATLAKRKRWIGGGPAMQRLGQKLQADVQPVLDKVTAAYLGGSVPAVSVMSLQRKLNRP